MRQDFISGNLAVIALIVAGFIIYGSLYPFAFHAMPPGAWRTLITSWDKRPERGDLIANILLYMPLGYFGLLSIRGTGRPRHLLLVVLAGLVLSVSMELLQYYDSGRDTEATDVYTNVAGTAIGASLAQGLGDLWSKLPRRRPGDSAALLLLAAWVGYNLFPFVPVIDLHKYWDAVKPLLHSRLDPYLLFAHVAVWFAAALLIEAVAPRRRSDILFAALIAVLIGGKVFVVGGGLTPAEIGGAGLAFVLYAILKDRPRERLWLAVILLAGAVIAGRLEPFHFVGRTGSFGWIPFLSFMGGSIGVDTLSFLEKAFRYGTLIWLLERAGWRLPHATVSVAAVLLATSIAEIFLPGRSAEITDAVMALLCGAVIALVRTPARPAPV
ncbi:MAG TPA: VanZ family protein [Rhizomicrobium sp.]|nr:VanZ family protein [Rhizomicrobium sp.]